MLPPALKAGLSLLSASAVVAPRTPSSASTTIGRVSFVLGSVTLVCTGTISSLNLPARAAAAAFLWELAAKASCSALQQHGAWCEGRELEWRLHAGIRHWKVFALVVTMATLTL